VFLVLRTASQDAKTTSKFVNNNFYISGFANKVGSADNIAFVFFFPFSLLRL
jgi:hypothetical protein